MQDIITRPSLRFWILKSSWKIILIVTCFVFLEFFKQNVYLKFGAASFILLLLVFCICDLIIIRQTKYIVTAEQIIIMTGVLVRKTNYIELYRIYDYSREQTISESICKLMTAKIMSRDISSPLLIMRGIPNDLSFINEIRKRVEVQKRIKGVYEINN